MVSNLKYFLEMFTTDDLEYCLRPYEILAGLEKQVMEDVVKGEISPTYFSSYTRNHYNERNKYS